MRFDVFAGPFTKNDQLTAYPFADRFLFIPNVPSSDANQVLPALNHEGADGIRALDSEVQVQFILEEREHELYARGYVDAVYRRWLEDMNRKNEIDRHAAATNLTLGYVTTDVCPTFFLSKTN